MWRGRAAEHVDGASLAVLRMAVGLTGAVSGVRLLAPGWAWSRYSDPRHRFTYLGFGWVPRLPHHGMTILVVVVATASILVALGQWYRPAIVVLFAGWVWIELLDATTYLNHYWFVTLVAALLCLAPADAALSLGARRRGERTIARGWVWLLRFQVGVVYTGAGIAKLNTDWLVHALPLRMWLPRRTHLPGLAQLMEHAWFAHVLSIAGAAFDCTVVVLLLHRRTRPFAFAAVVAVHGATGWLFQIGVFPWLMTAAATIFFAPGWPRRLLTMAARRWPSLAGVAAQPRVGSAEPRHPTLWLVLAGAWVVLQVVLPLRHLVIPGDHRWTGEGYRFAWNVLATEKAGFVRFHLVDPSTGERWTTDARRLYTDEQWAVMATDPDFIHQAAKVLAHDARAAGHADVEVRVDAWMSFNGRPATRLVDPTVDLAATPRSFGHRDWIMPGPIGPPPEPG